MILLYSPGVSRRRRTEHTVECADKAWWEGKFPSYFITTRSCFEGVVYHMSVSRNTYFQLFVCFEIYKWLSGRLSWPPDLSRKIDSWPAPLQSGSLVGYLCLDETVSVSDCTEPIVRKNFASLKRIERRCAAHIQYSVPCVGVVVSLYLWL